jgi:hypothetical protein
MLTKTLTTPVSVSNPENESPVCAGLLLMGGTGIEPVTSGLSSRRSPS